MNESIKAMSPVGQSRKKKPERHIWCAKQRYMPRNKKTKLRLCVTVEQTLFYPRYSRQGIFGGMRISKYAFHENNLIICVKT